MLHVELVLDVVFLTIEQLPNLLHARAVLVKDTTLCDFRRIGAGQRESECQNGPGFCQTQFPHFPPYSRLWRPHRVAAAPCTTPKPCCASSADVLNDGLEVEQDILVGTNILRDLINQKQQLEVLALGRDIIVELFDQCVNADMEAPFIQDGWPEWILYPNLAKALAPLRARFELRLGKEVRSFVPIDLILFWND